MKRRIRGTADQNLTLTKESRKTHAKEYASTPARTIIKFREPAALHCHVMTHLFAANFRFRDDDKATTTTTIRVRYLTCNDDPPTKAFRRILIDLTSQLVRINSTKAARICLVAT